MVASPAVAGQAARGRRQGGTKWALRLVVVHRATGRPRRRGKAPRCLRRVCPAAGEPRVQHRAVKVGPADLADWAARHAAARHPRWKNKREGGQLVSYGN